MDAFLWGSIKEPEGRDGAGRIMEAPVIGDKQPRRRSAECLCRKRNKGQKEQLAKQQKTPVAQLPLSLVTPESLL